MGRAWTEEERMERSVYFATDPLCPMCGEKDPHKFYLHAKNGRRSNAYCSDCHKTRCRERYKSKSMLQKRADRASKYGLTPEAYIKMYESQDGKCAICGLEPTTQRGLHIDHCHETNIVRGLLCHSCNIAIGNFKDSKDLLIKAINYLEGRG